MRLALLVIAGTALLLGCAGETPDEPDDPAGFAEARVVVTSTDRDTARSCRPGAVARELVGFTDALRGGIPADIRPFWNPRFIWFTVTSGSRKYGGDHLGTVLDDVESAAGFDISFEEVAVSRGTRRVSMSLDGTWISSSGTERPVQGKAEINCREGNIYVMSLALPPQGESIGVADCPDPPGDPAGDVLVACLRRT